MPKLKKHDNDWQVVQRQAQWISGSRAPELGPNDVIVLTRVRNAAEYIGPFVRHYQKLGVKHLFLLDNNSTDNTIEEASRFSQVTVLQAQLPYKRYKMAFLHFLLRQFGQQCWSLVVDIDEFFDYPFSEVIPLSRLVDYLDGNGFQAVVGQMLDMFPAQLPGAAQVSPAGNFLDAHIYYDLSEISKHQYHRAIVNNDWPNHSICFHRGGIRKAWFGLSKTVLTKFPLVRYVPDWQWESIHELYGCRVADFSGVLYHYKFRSDFEAYVREAVRKEQYNQNSKAYKSMLAAFETEGLPKELPATAQKNPEPATLARQGFLAVSEPYLRMAGAILAEKLPLRDTPLLQYQYQLLELAIERAAAAESELAQSRQRQHEELREEINKLRNTWSWKIGNAIVNPLKKMTRWLKK